MSCSKNRIGIDLGGTNIAAGILTPEGNLMGKRSIRTDVRSSGEKITEDMVSLCFTIMEAQGLKEEDIAAIGIGCPGFSDPQRGVLLKTVNLPFKNTNIREIFARKTSIPVYLGNDANAAALGEFTYGGAKGYSSSITITLGTGVGGGIIIDGKILAGFNFAGAELGHMVIKAGGRQCSCGRKGCLEAYASANALAKAAVRAYRAHPDSALGKLCGGDESKIDSKMAFDAAKKGDPVAKKVIDEYIEYLGEGIVNFINIFQPQIVLIGGGVSKQGEYLLAPLRKFVDERNYCKGVCESSRIERTLLGNDAGIIGAAILNEQYE
ncbi:MAG: ROK family glucokinase [Clostridia bacterium]|nr:ROK family glucokinase [Clostridia bacterium]